MKILEQLKKEVIVIIFFLLFFLIGIFIYKDYGISVDENYQRQLGIDNLKYIFFNDTSLLKNDDKYHGPIFEIFLVFVEKLLNLKDTQMIFYMRHLVTFSLFFSGVFFFYLLCKHRFNSKKLGLIGSLFLILSPRIFADSFYNSKDIPCMVLFIISIYTLVKFLENKTLKCAILHGIVCAILIDIRIIGMLVPAFTLFFYFLSRSTINLKKQFFVLFIYFFNLFIFVIIFFPTLWENPFIEFINTLRKMKYYPNQFCVLYSGLYIPNTNLPWHYIPMWLLITTPLTYSVFFFIGTFTIKELFKTILLKQDFNNIKIMDTIFLLWFFVPIFIVIIFKSVLYNGWRHLFFIYPAFLIISLNGLVTFVNFINRISVRINFSFYKNDKLFLKNNNTSIISILFIIVIFIYLINVLYFMIKNHPHQNVYFNILVSNNLEDNWELDYWRLSYKQGLQFLLKNEKKRPIYIYSHSESLLYPVILNSQILSSDERRSFIFGDNSYRADYFFTNFSMNKNSRYCYEIYSIIIEGTKIMSIYKIKSPFIFLTYGFKLGVSSGKNDI